MPPDANEKTPKQPPQLLFRVSEQALSELDAAAKRNGRSRNAEAAARIERSLSGESTQPADRALATLVSELTTRVAGQGLLGLLDPEYRGDELATLKGALIALLDELGATSDPKAMELGANVGKRFVLDARLAIGKEPSRRSPAEETLAEAATAWGLKFQKVLASFTHYEVPAPRASKPNGKKDA
jgi:hypothetical protein